MCRFLFITIVVCLLVVTSTTAQTLPLKNSGFEGQNPSPKDWTWWSRDDCGKVVSVSKPVAEGKSAAQVRYDGGRDWAFSSNVHFSVKPGDAFVAEAKIKVAKGTVTLAIVGYKGNEVIDWKLGTADAVGADWANAIQRTLNMTKGAAAGWNTARAYVVIPPECDGIRVRFVGDGPTEACMDAVSLKRWKREPKPKVCGFAQARVVEPLSRGLLVRPLGDGKVYLGWRFLASDTAKTGFHVYRRAESASADEATRLTEQPLACSTNYVDAPPNGSAKWTYFVRPVDAKGTLGLPSREVTIATTEKMSDYISIKLGDGHSFQKVGIADLDGDKRFDFVIKRPNSNVDPYVKYWKKSTEPYKLEAYRHDGTLLWRYDLGWSIETGIWYSPYVVYDFDGDGKAEVAVKTGKDDPREEDGRVRSGPEYVTILDGETGREITKAPWPSREGFGSNRPYNYQSRNQLGVAYLDGKTPCLIVARGTYNMMKAEAYQFHDGKLEKLWNWDNKGLGRRYWGQGAHWMHAADVDDDGREEVLLGSIVLDDNGDLLWSTGLGHPDHFYVGDLNPARPGLEIYYGIETRRASNGMCMVDAKSGQILWGYDERTHHIHSSGLVSDIDPAHPGCECYSGERDYKDKRWLRTCKGKVISTKDLGGLAPRAAFWDADPQRELLRRRRPIEKFSGEDVGPEMKNHIAAVADIWGDWREEIIVSAPGELRIYTTTTPTDRRFSCLMQDPIYRVDVAHAAMGYFQVPMMSKWAGFCRDGRNSRKIENNKGFAAGSLRRWHDPEPPGDGRGEPSCDSPRPSCLRACHLSSFMERKAMKMEEQVQTAKIPRRHFLRCSAAGVTLAGVSAGTTQAVSTSLSQLAGDTSGRVQNGSRCPRRRRRNRRNDRRHPSRSGRRENGPRRAREPTRRNHDHRRGSPFPAFSTPGASRSLRESAGN